MVSKGGKITGELLYLLHHAKCSASRQHMSEWAFHYRFGKWRYHWCLAAFISVTWEKSNFRCAVYQRGSGRYVLKAGYELRSSREENLLYFSTSFSIFMTSAELWSIGYSNLYYVPAEEKKFVSFWKIYSSGFSRKKPFLFFRLLFRSKIWESWDSRCRRWRWWVNMAKCAHWWSLRNVFLQLLHEQYSRKNVVSSYWYYTND